MKILLQTFLIIIAFIVISTEANAQWIQMSGSTKFQNSSFSCSVVSGTNIFVGSGETIFRSTDNGDIGVRVIRD